MPSEPAGNYRLLTDGEIVEAGDEFLNDDCESWSIATGFNIGRPYSVRAYVPFRRRLSKVKR